jgi:serine/threonine-protein kinase
MVDNRFRIVRVLGEGAMGVVYRAVQLSVDREVALKVLKAHLASDEESVRRFLREARAATRLSNPHSVTVFDFGRTEEGLLYLAMELIDGRSLYDCVVAEAPMPEERAAAIARQICEALVEAHDKGIIHRDLKPENVSLCTVGGDRDYVKVLDFGIARFLQPTEDMRVTATGMVVGTPCYMSPEQTRGHELDARTDLYAVGVMLFEMLSGELPFHGDSTLDLLLAKLENEPPSLLDTLRCVADEGEAGHERVAPLHVSPEMDDLVRRLMSRDRKLRPGSAREVVAELAALAESARRRPPAPAPSRRLPRPPATTFEPDPSGTTVVRDPLTAENTLVQRAAGPDGEATIALGRPVTHDAAAETATRPAGLGTEGPVPFAQRRLPVVAGVAALAVACVIVFWMMSPPSGEPPSAGAAAGSGEVAQSVAPVVPADRSGERTAADAGGLATADAGSHVAEAPAEAGMESDATAGVAAGADGRAAALETDAGGAVRTAAEVAVTLSSEPEGALAIELTDEGPKELGTTPVTFTGLPGEPARHVRLSKKGYVPAEVAVNLAGEASQRIALRPLPSKRPSKPPDEKAYRPERLVNDPGELK